MDAEIILYHSTTIPDQMSFCSYAVNLASDLSYQTSVLFSIFCNQFKPDTVNVNEFY